MIEENQTLRIKLDQISRQKSSATQSPVQEKGQIDPASTIELANLKIKNEELNAHLSSAERFISSLERRIEELVEGEQQARNAVLHER